MKPNWNLNTFAFANEDKLPGFGKLLSSWLSLHQTFCEGAMPDFSWEWGHHERAQTGLLANAAMLIGGLSIEESWTRKNTGQGSQYSGRGDLWLRLSPPTSENDYLIEAKQKYVEIGSGLEKTSRVVAQQMNNALASAKLASRKDHKHVAMAFLSLTFKNKELASLEQNTSTLISHLRNQSQAQKDLDAIGAIWMGAKDFQSSRHDRERDHPDWKLDTYGIIILGSRVTA